MDRFDRFVDILKVHLRRTRWTPGKLAEKSQVPKATIVNWLNERSARPRDWQPIAQIAAAFELDDTEASELLERAGHPPISELLTMRLMANDRALLAPWGPADRASDVSGSRPPVNAIMPTQMPTTRLEAIAPLPPSSHMYLWRNPFFVGHKGLLLAIARILSGDEQMYGQRINTVVLTGIGGSGKSQIATEWVHRYGQYYPGGVFWVSFSDPRSIPERIAQAGQHAFPELGAVFETLPLDDRIRLVWNLWHDGTPRLLVFDGCEDEALLRQWRPANGTTSVIVTSRRAKWSRLLGMSELPIPMLKRAESIELLGRYRPDCADMSEDLDAIAETLGDLPFALHLAGLYLDQYEGALTPSTYHKQLEALADDTKRTVFDHPSMQRGGVSPTDHEQHLRRTFERSYQRLDETGTHDSLALKVLAHAAAFSPARRVSHALLRASVAPDPSTDDDMLLFEDAVRRLLDLGLLLFTDDAFEIHPLIAQYVNASTLIVTARERVRALLASVNPGQR